MNGPEIAFLLLAFLIALGILGYLDYILRPPGWERIDDRTYERPDGYTVHRCNDGVWVILTTSRRASGPLLADFTNPITAMRAVEHADPYEGGGPTEAR